MEEEILLEGDWFKLLLIALLNISKLLIRELLVLIIYRRWLVTMLIKVPLIIIRFNKTEKINL